jgi:hypothetical protein
LSGEREKWKILWKLWILELFVKNLIDTLYTWELQNDEKKNQCEQKIFRDERKK